AREGHVEWVFSPDNVITQDVAARQGYALRVCCETADNDRRVLIGTVTDKTTVAWDPLNTCRITQVGIVTPTPGELSANGRIRLGGMRNDPLPASLPLRGSEIVFAPGTRV
ncbi:hypothetical protein, partial [Streptomyces sp. bgisy027]|uniref:hypothetical protein n=1 Tax=Streptomyces sp. bgisy027 TaxID=3413770 RepID=UPI003D74342F